MSIAIKLYGNYSPTVANIQHLLGINYNHLKQYETALQHFNHSLSIYKSIYGNSDEVAYTLIGIGVVYQNKKDYNKALQFYEESLTIKKKLFGEKHIQLAHATDKIAIILKKQ